MVVAGIDEKRFHHRSSSQDRGGRRHSDALTVVAAVLTVQITTEADCAALAESATVGADAAKVVLTAGVAVASRVAPRHTPISS